MDIANSSISWVPEYLNFLFKSNIKQMTRISLNRAKVIRYSLLNTCSLNAQVQVLLPWANGWVRLRCIKLILKLTCLCCPMFKSFHCNRSSDDCCIRTKCFSLSFEMVEMVSLATFKNCQKSLLAQST